MREHWQFSKEQDRSFGVFYPLHYVVAAFETPERAEDVRRIFVDSGFDDGDVASATGSFVTQKLESMSGSTWIEHFKIGFASFLGTELGYIDDDHKLAQRGAGFLVIYTPGDASIAKRRARHPGWCRACDANGACIRVGHDRVARRASAAAPPARCSHGVHRAKITRRSVIAWSRRVIACVRATT